MLKRKYIFWSENPSQKTLFVSIKTHLRQHSYYYLPKKMKFIVIKLSFISEILSSFFSLQKVWFVFKTIVFSIDKTIVYRKKIRNEIRSLYQLFLKTIKNPNQTFTIMYPL